MEFGEMGRFKTRSQEAPGVDGQRYHDGIFLGIDRSTGQYMLYSGGEVKLSRTAVRVPEAEKWNKDRLAEVNLTPRSLVGQETQRLYSETSPTLRARSSPTVRYWRGKYT